VTCLGGGGGFRAALRYLSSPCSARQLALHREFFRWKQEGDGLQGRDQKKWMGVRGVAWVEVSQREVGGGGGSVPPISSHRRFCRGSF